MNYHEARKKLERYFEDLEFSLDVGLQSTGIIIVLNSSERLPVSKVEGATAKVFDLMARMQDTKEALEALPAEYVRFIEVRFRDRLSGRHAAKIMEDEKIAKITHPHRYENDVLAAYISALGYVVVR
jgi:hypothetical protein